MEVWPTRRGGRPSLGLLLLLLFLTLLLAQLPLAAGRRELKTAKKKAAAVDACFGVVCPGQSKCSSTVVPNVATCVCPGTNTHLTNNTCSSAPLNHSDYLDPHNNARAAVGSQMLTWNDALAESAQAWANNLAANYSCALLHPYELGLRQTFGQNLARSSYMMVKKKASLVQLSNTDAVNLWVAEGINYTYHLFDGRTAGCSTGNWSDCGHFTQVMWNATLRVGCGVSTCATKMVWACNYEPYGNVMGQYPYKKNPCFRYSCPATATCVVSSAGAAVCQCPKGQIIVNGACKKDPCIGTTCPGNQVCNGTTGKAVCGCASGFIIAPKNTARKKAASSSDSTCVPAVCQNTYCPSTSTCTVNADGAPYCACPSGYSFDFDGTTCTNDSNNAVASTSIALYRATDFSGVPAVLRVAYNGCVNIPASHAGKILSYQTISSVNETLAPGSTAYPCREGVFFCLESDCWGDCRGFPDYTAQASGLIPAVTGALSLLC